MGVKLLILCLLLLIELVKSKENPQRICLVSPQQCGPNSNCHLLLMEPTFFGIPHPEFVRQTTDFSDCSIDYAGRSRLLTSILSHLVDYLNSAKSCFEEEIIIINSKTILELAYQPRNDSAEWNKSLENLVRDNNLREFINMLRSFPDIRARLPYIVYLLENIPDSLLVFLDHPALLDCLISNKESTERILQDPLIFQVVQSSPGLLRTICKVQNLIRDVGKLTSLVNLTDDENPEVLNALILTSRVLSSKRC